MLSYDSEFKPLTGRLGYFVDAYIWAVELQSYLRIHHSFCFFLIRYKDCETIHCYSKFDEADYYILSDKDVISWAWKKFYYNATKGLLCKVDITDYIPESYFNGK